MGRQAHRTSCFIACSVGPISYTCRLLYPSGEGTYFDQAQRDTLVRFRVAKASQSVSDDLDAVAGGETRRTALLSFLDGMAERLWEKDIVAWLCTNQYEPRMKL